MSDTNIKGLGKRNGSWHLRRMVSGRLINKSIGRVDTMRLEDAEKISLDLLNGKSLATSVSPQKQTLQDVIDDLLTSPKGIQFKDSYRNLITYCAKSKFPEFASKPIADITKDEIKAWYRRGHNAPTFTDTVFRVLNRLFEYAIALEVIEKNPCTIVSKTGRYKKNVRAGHIPSDQSDIGKFAWALVTYQPKQKKTNYQTARDCILLMLVTGMRKNEAMALMWSDVDLVRKKLTLKDTKNRRDHTIPLTRLTYAMLKTRHENRYDLNKGLKGKSSLTYVFPNRLGNGHLKDTRKTMEGLCADAGIDRVTLHDLRRTFVTAGEHLSIDDATVKRMVNHHMDVTAGYRQTSMKTLRDNFEKISAHISLAMPVIIGEEEIEYGAGEPDNLMNMLYGDEELVHFSPIVLENKDHFEGI